MLTYQTFGNEQNPTVLFLHGFMGTADVWSDIIAELAQAYYYLAVDLPGHGASTGLFDEAYTMAGAAQALVDLLDERDIDQCAVVGYSMGGRLALFFALHFPERCRMLILESASPGLKTAQERSHRRAVDGAHASRLETANFETFLHAWYQQPIFASLAGHAGLIEQMIARRRTNDPRELARSLRGMGTGSQPSLWERLPALRVSTCAVAGALDEKYVEITRQMEAASPLVQALVVPEAGHNVHAEQPYRFITLLHRCLSQT